MIELILRLYVVVVSFVVEEVMPMTHLSYTRAGIQNFILGLE